jgi:DNA-binding PadR family transcriptional regulator
VAFGRREGKQIVFPVGLGSALTKAVREGYLQVVGDEQGKRRRTYEFTRKGLDLVG